MTHLKNNILITMTKLLALSAAIYHTFNNNILYYGKIIHAVEINAMSQLPTTSLQETLFSYIYNKQLLYTIFSQQCILSKGNHCLYLCKHIYLHFTAIFMEQILYQGK